MPEPMPRSWSRTSGSVWLRLLEVLYVLTFRLLLPLVLDRGRRAAKPGPVLLRTSLERLGGAWTKLGQALAMRFDLLPPAYCYELFSLLNSVQPFPYSRVAEVIARELGAPPEVLFASFETEPMAAASIGQVHRAALKSGEAVAVKVQRPGIEALFARDTSLMRAGAGLLDFIRLFGYTHWRDVVDEFARWTHEELDYTVEARHAAILRDNATDDLREVDARIYTRYSTSRVLTTELMQGVPIIDVLYALGSQNQAYLAELQARGVELAAVARTIDLNMLNQVYVNGYFHADLHPANLFILPKGAIGYVDFGIVGRLPDDVRESLLEWTIDLFRGDPEKAADELIRWITPSASTSLADARREIVDAGHDFLFRLRRLGPQDADGSPARAFAMRLLQAIRRHRLVLSPSLVMYLKTLVTVDTIRYRLAPDYDLSRQTTRFLTELIATAFEQSFDPRRLARASFEFRYRVRRLLGILESADTQAESVERTALDAWHRVRAFGGLALMAAISLGALVFLRAYGQITSSLLYELATALVAAISLLVLLIIGNNAQLGRTVRHRHAFPRVVRRR